MPRVKRGPSHIKKRRKILKAVKGYRHGRKKLIKLAKVAILKAGVYAYRDRRNKKRVNRRLWQIKLNAAVRVFDISYSKFINLLKTNNVELDRKVLADLAENKTELFGKIVEKLKPTEKYTNFKRDPPSVGLFFLSKFINYLVYKTVDFTSKILYTFSSHFLDRWCSWLTRRPVTAKIASSSLVRSAKKHCSIERCFLI